MPSSLRTNIPDYDEPTNFFELGYVLDNKDTSLVLYHYNKNKTLLNKTKFDKVLMKKKDDDVASGLQYIVNKKLISGVYSMHDTSGSKITVQFDDEGNIFGVQGFKTYYVITDFAAEPENKMDEICFDIQTPNQKCYNFQIRKDTLEIYQENENLDNESPSYRQLKYKLIKN
jgi:hypothetical protein